MSGRGVVAGLVLLVSCGLPAEKQSGYGPASATVTPHVVLVKVLAQPGNTSGVAVDADGNVFYTQVGYSANGQDGGCQVLERVAKTGRVATVLGSRLRGRSEGPMRSLRIKLEGCWALAAGPSDSVFAAVALRGYGVVVRATLRDGRVKRVAGSFSFGTALGDGGPATRAPLLGPEGIAVDRKGDLFIAETYGYRIREVSAKGIIRTIAGNGKSGFSGDGGLATRAELDGPRAVALDGNGDLFIADQGNDRVREVFARSHIIRTVAGGASCTKQYCGNGGPATQAGFVGPLGLAVDKKGNIFLAASNRILEVDSHSKKISSIAGTGTLPRTPDEVHRQLLVLPAGQVQIEPVALAVGSGRIVFADASGGLIRMLILHAVADPTLT